MVNVTTADALNEEVVRRVVHEAVHPNLQFRRAYQDINFSGEPNDTLQIPKEKNDMGKPEKIAEGAEFPRDEEDVEKVSVTVEKYGFETSVSTVSEEDSVFDIVARQVERQARRMEEKLNEEAFSELDSNLNTDSPVDAGDTAGTLEFSDVMEGKKTLQQDDYQPDTLIVNVQGHTDLVNSSEFQRATDLGDETIEEGMVGRVAGFNVFLDTAGHMSASNGEAYMVDSGQYGYEVVKEDVSTQSYDDPSRHATVYQIWTRRAWEAVDSGAAVKIEP